jgi:hypothetical protein
MSVLLLSFLLLSVLLSHVPPNPYHRIIKKNNFHKACPPQRGSSLVFPVFGLVPSFTQKGVSSRVIRRGLVTCPRAEPRANHVFFRETTAPFLRRGVTKLPAVASRNPDWRRVPGGVTSILTPSADIHRHQVSLLPCLQRRMKLGWDPSLQVKLLLVSAPGRNRHLNRT